MAFTPFFAKAPDWEQPSPAHRFLNCDGPLFSRDWKDFHATLTSTTGRDLSEVVNQAQWLAYKWQETADEMCLDFNDHDWFVRFHANYHTEHLSGLEKLVAVRVFTGNLEPKNLKGFCPLGFAMVAALVAEAHLQIFGERLNGWASLEDQKLPVQWRMDKAITFLRLVMKCLGPQLSMDFLESSWWPLSTLDVRIALSALESVDWWALNEVEMAEAYLQIPRSFQSWTVDFVSPAVLPAAFRLDTFLPSGGGPEVPLGVRKRQALRLRIAIFGMHGSLMAEPAFTMAEAFGKPPVGPEVLQSRFFGMGWPSRFRCKVLKNCKSPNPRIDRWMGNFTGYIDHGFRWSEDAEESALEFLVKEMRRDRFLRRADLLVCTLARLCPLLRRATDNPDTPMFMYFSMTLTWSSDSAQQDRRILTSLQRMLTNESTASSGRTRHFAAVTSHLWAAQALYQTGLSLPVLRPLARYVGNVSYIGFSNPGKINVLLARSRVWVGTAHGTAFLKMLDYFSSDMLPFELVPQGAEWIDYTFLGMFRCILLMPHHPVVMALYDYYAVGVPIIVPSKRYMCRMLQLQGHTFHIRENVRYMDSIEVSVANMSVLSGFPYSPMPQTVPDVRHAAFLVELMSYYTLPHVATFDSFQDLRVAVVSSDKLRSDKMLAEQRRHAAKITEVYRRRVLTLLPERRVAR